MTVQTFRELLARRPFQPFRVVMSSGKTYDVRHPEMAFLTRTTLYVGVDDRFDGVPSDAAMCSLLHITNAEPVNGAETSTSS